MSIFHFAAVLTLIATPAAAMELTSKDVAQGALFPVTEICARYGGSDLSPALSWSGVPEKAKSLAVTMFDPDAHGGWWHWQVLNMPTSMTALAQGAGKKNSKELSEAHQQGNSNGNESYDGPCPPEGSGLHHYEITLWALDTDTAAVDVNTEPGDVGAYLAKHAVAQARITPVYKK